VPSIPEFFKNWNVFEEGWSLVGSMIIYDDSILYPDENYDNSPMNNTNIANEIFSITSNEVPITQELFRLFVNGGEKTEKIIDINDMNINIGDTVIVRKAGDIIPEVLSLVKKGENSGSYKMPTSCPSCGSKVFRDDEAAIRCTNPDCPAQLLRNLIHFASRDAMDIEGLGPAVVELLVDSNLISREVDIFTLSIDDIKSLDRMGEKSAENLINAIEKSKSNDLSKAFRFAFG
jgi:hypothetical protein